MAPDEQPIVETALHRGGFDHAVQSLRQLVPVTALPRLNGEELSVQP